MRIEEIIKWLRIGAKKYHENLENKNFMIIYEEDNILKYIELRFLSGNFLHLTGVQLKDSQSATLFYKKCLNGKISKKEIGVKKDGTTQLKLRILEMITNICKIAKMVGEYDETRENLYIQFIIGTSYISLGFIKDKNKYFIPNTALNENIKNITYKTNKIVAIFSKKVNEIKYQEICFLKIKNIKSREILDKLDDNIKLNFNS